MPLGQHNRQSRTINQADRHSFSYLYFLSRNQPEVLQQSGWAKHIDAEALHRSIKKQRKAGMGRAGLRFMLNFLRVIIRPFWAVMAGVTGMVVQVIAVLMVLGWRGYLWLDHLKSGAGSGAKTTDLLWRFFALGAVCGQLVNLAGAFNAARVKVVDAFMPVVELMRSLVEWIGLQDQIIRKVDLDITDVRRSPLWWLVQSEAGIKVLSEIENLADKISADNLNNEYYYMSRQEVDAQGGVSNDGYGCEGMSILAILMMSQSGRELLLKHKKLIAKINKQGLLSCIKSRRGGAFRGTSVLWMLSSKIIPKERTGLVNIDEGMTILAQIDDLADKIGIAELIQPPPIRRFNKFSPIVLWVSMKEGNELLARNPRLRGGLTVLQLLCMHDAGIDALSTMADIENEISQDVLNEEIRTDSFAGCSVLLLLSASEKGRGLLRRKPGLCQKIESQALFRQVQGDKYAGTSAFWHLLLANDTDLLRTELLSGVTESVLMQRPRSVTGGDSVLEILLFTPSGLCVLEACCEVLAQLTPEILDQENSLGQPALLKFAQTRKGREILAGIPAIEDKITAEGLNKIVQTHPERSRECALWYLCEDDHWRGRFKHSSKLRANIDETMLQLGLRKIRSEMTDMHSEDRIRADSDINEILRMIAEDTQREPELREEEAQRQNYFSVS